MYLDMSLTFLETGPSTTNLELLNQFRRLTPMHTSYLKTISADKLRLVIATFKRPFNQRDDGLTLEKYVYELRIILTNHFLGNLSSEQWVSCRLEFLDLYMCYLEQLCGASKEMADLYDELLSSIKSKSDDGIFAPDVSHLDSFRRGLKTIRDAMASPKLGSMDYIHRKLDLTVSCIVHSVRKNGPMLEQLLDDLMQTLTVIAKGRNDRFHVRMISALENMFRDDDVKSQIKNKPKLFEMYCPLLTDLGSAMQGPVIMGRFIAAYTSDFLHLASGGGGENIQAATLLFNAICELRCPEEPLNGATNDLENRELENLLPEKVANEQSNFMKAFLDEMKTLNLLPHLQERLVSFTLQCLESRSSVMFTIGKACTSFISLQKNKDLGKPILVTLDRLFRDEEFPWDDNSASIMGQKYVANILESYKDGKDMAQINDLLISLFLTTMNKDHTDYDNGSLNMFGWLMMSPMEKFIRKHSESNTAATLTPMLGDMFRHLDHDNERIQQLMRNQFSILARSDATMFTEYLDTFFDKYLEDRSHTFLQILGDAYSANPKVVIAHFQKLMDIAEDMESAEQTYLFILMGKIATNDYKVITTKNVEYLLGEPLENSNTEGTILNFFYILSQKAAVLFKPHVDKLIQLMSSSSRAAPALCPAILSNVGAVCKEQTEEIYKAILKELKAGKIDSVFLSGLGYALRTLLLIKPEIGRMDQSYYRELAEAQPSLKDMCRAIDDVIEGRSLEKVSDELEQQAVEIENLDNRVTETEDNVATLDKEVGSQRKDISTLQTDVDEHSEKLFRIQGVVDDTVMKVEEIDMKTISNAPAFSRQISKLLNPESDHDWRLMAQHLGYGVDDIRGWATQSDPCMALLSEWYSTHRTSEATHAVLKTLKEINRVNAAEIVEQWLESVKDVIDDDPPEYATPPPAFLSYQCGHQGEVKLLRKHLGMAGYECWMDVGQMGGGDKLFAKIDQGIRAAKLVICCVTEKYALSPNCNRDVTLAVNLGKPIIPLLVESLSWPPPGSMGSIFSEYLYVRFFLGENEPHPHGVVWPMNSFQELLMQLNYNKIMPEQDKVTSEYKNWWQPPDEEIIIPVREMNNESKTPAATTSGIQQSPGAATEVYLSYQWGMQPQVKTLYKVLTSHGHRVWMDTHQMGGGDSLYDKIDKGIRGCRVIVSCVTENYTKSANCRREVSLADAIKKPIVPLLLETTDWPPSGPMGMVFSQLLYIDMATEVLKEWGGNKLDELVAQLRGYIPDGDPMDGNINTTTGKPSTTAIAVDPEKSQKTTIKCIAAVQPSSRQETKAVTETTKPNTKTDSGNDKKQSATAFKKAKSKPSSKKVESPPEVASKSTSISNSASKKTSPPTSKSSVAAAPLPSNPKGMRPSSASPKKKSKSCTLV